MANKRESEVAVKIGGKTLKLKYTTRSMVVAEEFIGKPINLWLLDLNEQEKRVEYTLPNGDKIDLPTEFPSTLRVLELTHAGLLHYKNDEGEPKYSVDWLAEVIKPYEVNLLFNAVARAIALASTNPAASDSEQSKSAAKEQRVSKKK